MKEELLKLFNNYETDKKWWNIRRYEDFESKATLTDFMRWLEQLDD